MQTRVKRVCGGQSLIELMATVGVVLILIAGLIVGTTYSIKTVRTGTLKSEAIKYAQEGMEIVRAQRDLNWTAFQAYSGTWCIDENSVWSQGPNCPTNIKGIFSRSAFFTWTSATSTMDVVVSVSWFEGETVYETPVESYFTQWK